MSTAHPRLAIVCAFTPQVICREYLLATGQFRHVWLLQDVPQHVRELLALGTRDMGMDLVCERWAPLVATAGVVNTSPIAPKKRPASAAAVISAKRVYKRTKVGKDVAAMVVPIVPNELEEEKKESQEEQAHNMGGAAAVAAAAATSEEEVKVNAQIGSDEDDEDQHMSIDTIEEEKHNPAIIVASTTHATTGPLYCAVQAKYRRRSDKASVRINVRASGSNKSGNIHSAGASKQVMGNMCCALASGASLSSLRLPRFLPLPPRERLARKHAFHALIRPLGVSLALALAPPLTPTSSPRKLCYRLL
jgi:hypothetical protein